MTRACLVVVLLAGAGCFDFSRFDDHHDLGGQMVAACGTAPGGNLLAPNSDQFTGGYGGWAINDFVVTAAAPGPAGCFYPTGLKVCPPKAALSGSQLYIDYGTAENASYTFETWIVLEDPTATHLTLQMAYCDADMNTIGNGGSSDSGTSWQHLTMTTQDAAPCPMLGPGGNGTGVEFIMTFARNDGTALLPTDCFAIDYASVIKK